MIDKRAIELAIEGGWKKSWKHFRVDRSFVYFTEQSGVIGSTMWERIALDPSFWQALAKALGWKDTPVAGETFDHKQWHESSDMHSWQYFARSFYDLILTGGDTKKFWDEILKV